MGELKIDRPIVFFDLETTGTDREKDRIIEIAQVKLFPDGTTLGGEFRFNPGIPISPAATEIHGITDKDVEFLPGFEKLAQYIFEFFKDCDIAGFNSNFFDVPMLFNEYRRAGITWDYNQHKFIDVGNIYKIQEPRTLEAAMRFYCGKEHTGAHNARADADATIEVFKAQMERYEDIPGTVAELAYYSNYSKKLLDLSGKFAYDNDGNIVFTFGEYRSEPAIEHPDYLQWILSKEFPSDTLDVALKLLAIANGDDGKEILGEKPFDDDEGLPAGIINDDDEEDVYPF